jgi:hypothetical protein
MIECDHCGVEVQDGAFCAACGAHLIHHDDERATERRHAFAAHPHEAVHHPAVLTTILPHLTQLRLHKYRWALIGGAGLVMAALMFANAGAAVVLAATIVPLLYVLYIYDADVHEGEPFAVIACTVISGALFGVLVALIGRAYVARVTLLQMGSGMDRPPSLGYLLLFGVALPILGQLAVLAGPLLLRRWPHFRNEVMDGIVFGVAAGVGFAGGSTLVNYWPMVRIDHTPGACDPPTPHPRNDGRADRLRNLGRVSPPRAGRRSRPGRLRGYAAVSVGRAVPPAAWHPGGARLSRSTARLPPAFASPRHP